LIDRDSRQARTGRSLMRPDRPALRDRIAAT
jgi:hypothetical protein